MINYRLKFKPIGKDEKEFDLILERKSEDYTTNEIENIIKVQIYNHIGTRYEINQFEVLELKESKPLE